MSAAHALLTSGLIFTAGFTFGHAVGIHAERQRQARRDERARGFRRAQGSYR